MPTDDMYERTYWQVQAVLDKAIGEKEDDGAGEGLVADVRLLVEQRDNAQAERDRALAEVERLAKEQSRWLRAYDAEWDKNYNLNAEVERLRAGIKAMSDGIDLSADPGDPEMTEYHRCQVKNISDDLAALLGEDGAL